MDDTTDRLNDVLYMDGSMLYGTPTSDLNAMQARLPPNEVGQNKQAGCISEVSLPFVPSQTGLCVLAYIY